ncbi:hypothetical protein DENSPDRAFT_844847 [Dentipellis sp. KUC8613]|nr:hypothetical protein DENSPDRAFT_844847 [Dentipellis sp. KUC8613]
MHAVALFSILFFTLFSFAYALPIGHGHVHRRDHHNVKVHKRTSCPRHVSTSAAASETAAASAPSVQVAAAKKGKDATSTSTSSAPKATSSSKSNSTSSSDDDAPSGGSSVEQMLFPKGRGSSSWTTASDLSGAIPLSDATFRPTKLIKSLSHTYMQSPGPDSKLSMQAKYPEGSWTYDHDPAGGLSFYAPGPEDVDLSTAKEVTFGYAIMFENDFEWKKGGKIPGLYGGDNDEVAASCSGGRRDARCFSTRMMWREDGAGELYTYLPPSDQPQFAANKVQCNVAPKSECNPEYGSSVGRGSFTFKAGEWNYVAQRVLLNDVDKGQPQANGEMQLWFNGESVINVDKVIIRANEAGAVRGIQMQTFFGGHTSDYASPKDQETYFTDFSMAITQKK